MERRERGDALLIGPGKVARAVFAPLLEDAGFGVRFVCRTNRRWTDLEKEVLRTSLEQYTVRIISHHGDAPEERLTARDPRGVVTEQEELNVLLTRESTTLCAVCVQYEELPGVAGQLAPGLRSRYVKRMPRLPLLVVVNVPGGGEYFAGILGSISEDAAEAVECLDVSLDCIVPAQDVGNVVIREKYAQVAVEKSADGVFSDVRGITVTSDMKMIETMKLLGVNGQHFMAAILGHALGIATIREAVQDPAIATFLREGALPEIAIALTRATATEDRGVHEKFLHSALDRFGNPYITDSCARVLQNTVRKLGRDERLVRSLLQCREGEDVCALPFVLAVAIFGIADGPRTIPAIGNFCGFQIDEEYLCRMVVTHLRRIEETGVQEILYQQLQQKKGG